MNKLLLGACLAALISGAAGATSFTFSDQLDTGSPGAGLVTGSFDGTLNGNLITNLSNINVFLDGVALAGNGSLFSARYSDALGFYDDGGGIASLDGSQNDFLFIETDYVAGDYSYTSFFYSVITGGVRQEYAYNYDPFTYGYSVSNTTHFTAQVAGAVPEPASWALMLGGFGAIGGALRTRRKAAVSFG